MKPNKERKNYHDPIVGKKFGKLLVMRRLPDRSKGAKNVRAVVSCKCDCGNTVEVVRYYLQRPNPKTHCGCENTTSSKARFPGEYGIWNMMFKRCYDETHVSYKDYGGRGIRVAAPWHGNFDKFLEDLGPRPDPFFTLDRKDVNGNYSKENCRWATPKEQSANKRGSANSGTGEPAASNAEGAQPDLVTGNAEV